MPSLAAAVASLKHFIGVQVPVAHAYSIPELLDLFTSINLRWLFQSRTM